MNEEYKKHIGDAITFASRVMEDKTIVEPLGGHLQDKLFSIIVEKCVSPYHYFEENKARVENANKPTDKQIAFATKLGIDKPETYTKQDLSTKIDETKGGGYAPPTPSFRVELF